MFLVPLIVLSAAIFSDVFQIGMRRLTWHRLTRFSCPVLLIIAFIYWLQWNQTSDADIHRHQQLSLSLVSKETQDFLSKQAGHAMSQLPAVYDGASKTDLSRRVTLSTLLSEDERSAFVAPNIHAVFGQVC